jgi:uncharacterized secreted protein with C-terminal beta-propeller domain
MEAKTRARGLAVIAAGGIAGVALATGVVGGSGGLRDPDEAAASALEPFSSCDQLLEYAREHRWAQNPYPLATEGVAVLNASGVAEDTAFRAAVPQADALGPGETGTNVQEVGIDEPDIAKLSGSTLFRVQGKALRAYDVSGDSAVLLDELELQGGGDPQLLISGEKGIVIANDYAGGSAKTAVTEVDLSEPAAMSAIRTLELEGTHVSARLAGDIARLVIESRPEYPGIGGGPAPEQDEPDEDPPTGATGETGPGSEDDDEPGWMPRATLFETETGERSSAPLAGCGDVAFPDEFAGLGLLSVLTIDASESILPTDVDVVMTDGSTVYAGESGLYVATMEMVPPREGVVDSIGRFIGPDMTTVPVQPPGDTQIHRFATTGDATEYAASGEVPGRLIGQFAMSESEGLLRVASTSGDTWTEGPNESESMVTVLAEDDGTLIEVGQVGGLGRGEQIYAVRFIDDMGYVVTFEQTDPLYTVDLSDPEDPQMTGELKIPGYSAYLHPVGDGRLLGIGQAGTAGGTVTGAQASLFDVADPTSPERLDALDLADGRWSSTATEWDHHAFLYSPEHALAVVPVQSFGRSSSASATAFAVGPDGELILVARLDAEGQIERTLVAGDNLVTVSTKAVAVRPIDDLG